MSFQKNCEALLFTGRSNAQGLVRAIQDAALPDSNAMVLLPNESGDCGFEYQGIWLHDAQNPVEEVRQCIQKSCELKQDHVHLIFGLGLPCLKMVLRTNEQPPRKKSWKWPPTCPSW